MKMKKLSFAFALLLAVLTLPIHADNIGFIDTEKVAASSKMVQTYQKNIAEKQDEFKKFYDAQQKKLESEKEKASKAKDKPKAEKDLQETFKKLDDEVKAKQQELVSFDRAFNENFLTSLRRASKEASKKYGVDVVVEKNVLYSGGFDLTDSVIQIINQ